MSEKVRFKKLLSLVVSFCMVISCIPSLALMSYRRTILPLVRTSKEEFEKIEIMV